MEDKQQICNLLCKTLQATRNACDLERIHYHMMPSGDEFAILEFEHGKKEVCISMDSGTAIIKDIVKVF